MILTPTAEFKVFLMTLAVLFAAVLTVARISDERRPKFLFVLFLIYLVFQSFQFMEFFPFTSFQRYAQSQDASVRYIVMKARLGNGTEFAKAPEKVLPALGHGRLKHFLKMVFRNPRLTDELATSYARAYEKRFSESSEWPIWDLRYEKMKWNVETDPYDADHGYLLKRLIGEPQG